MRTQDRYDSLFSYYAQESGVDWRLLKAQATAESGLDPDALSQAGAVGLAQFMPRTWSEWEDGQPGIHGLPGNDGKLIDPRDPEDAIRAQAAYMRWLLDRFEHNRVCALAAYNWGIKNVRKCMEIAGDGWLDAAPEETRAYVERIVNLYDGGKSPPP